MLDELTFCFILGLDSWNSKTKKLMKRQHELTIPLLRSQLNFIMQKEKGVDFFEYANGLHDKAVQAFKRADIPTSDDNNKEKELSKIGKVGDLCYNLQFYSTARYFNLLGALRYGSAGVFYP